LIAAAADFRIAVDPCRVSLDLIAVDQIEIARGALPAAHGGALARPHELAPEGLGRKVHVALDLLEPVGLGDHATVPDRFWHPRPSSFGCAQKKVRAAISSRHGQEIEMADGEAQIAGP
jgi:hypothetical protein